MYTPFAICKEIQALGMQFFTEKLNKFCREGPSFAYAVFISVRTPWILKRSEMKTAKSIRRRFLTCQPGLACLSKISLSLC